MRYTGTTLLLTSAFALSGVSYAVDAVSVPRACAPITAETAAGAPTEFVAGEIVVVFEDDVTSAAIEALVEEAGGTVAESSALNSSRVVISVPKGQEDDYIEAYLRLEGVRNAEKNYVFETQAESGPTKHKVYVTD